MVKQQQPNRRKRAGRKASSTKSRSAAATDRATRNSRLNNGQPKKSRRGNAARSAKARSSKQGHALDLKAAMGAIAATASRVAHTAAEDSRLAGRKVAALWEKSQRSISRLGAKAKETLAAGAARSKQWVSPRRSNGRRTVWRNPLGVLVKAVNSAASPASADGKPGSDSRRNDHSAAA